MLIGELAAAAGVSTATIRFYERSGLLTPPERTSGGYRDYPDRAVAELRFVRAGQAVGLTLTELAEITAFRDRGEAPCGELVALMEHRMVEVEHRINELDQLRRDLAVLLDAAHAHNLDDCPPATMYGLLERREPQPSRDAVAFPRT
ncbi:heavy metal-responsive transcriptional regulator [Sporichthya sp.]|uniref:heavy metal-responsive transcriptional regulator n=1 Tax=Sporichthya sp. TaxID=65475 RepID=UPI00181D99C1|nr:heavy metal-responsive transcriptional regulator [Sporichthya sp.]MBA3743973.1 heavy metal-responsive transcriptional regulator [Sporichthya sp.]